MKWFAYIWIGILLVLTAISIPQCLHSGGSLFNMAGQQSALDPHGPLAENQLGIFYLVMWVTIFLFVTVGGALAFAIWKFRQRKGDDPDYIPPQSHGHPLVELSLIVASTLLLVVIAIPTFQGILLKDVIPSAEDSDVVEINVVGYQWWWGFEYPEHGFHTANELVFPAGKRIKLNLKANDVIHSFWLPKLGGKTDLVPARDNEMWLMADEPGYFWGQCAEYCGDSHAYMLFRAKALPEEEYLAWVEHQKTGTVVGAGDYTPLAGATDANVLRGAELFKDNCARCHSVDSKLQTMGPNLAHFGSRTSIAAGWLENETENLVEWILRPQTIKQGNFMWHGFPNPDDRLGPPQMEGLKDANLTQADAEALAAYLYMLK